MRYQIEAQFEQLLIQRVKLQGFDVLIKDYDYYFDKFNDCVQALYTVAKTPSDVDFIKLEEEKNLYLYSKKFPNYYLF